MHPCIPSLIGGGVQHGLGRVHGSAWSCMRSMVWYGMDRGGRACFTGWEVCIGFHERCHVGQGGCVWVQHGSVRVHGGS